MPHSSTGPPGLQDRRLWLLALLHGSCRPANQPRLTHLSHDICHPYPVPPVCQVRPVLPPLAAHHHLAPLLRLLRLLLCRGLLRPVQIHPRPPGKRAACGLVHATPPAWCGGAASTLPAQGKHGRCTGAGSPPVVNRRDWLLAAVAIQRAPVCVQPSPPRRLLQLVMQRLMASVWLPPAAVLEWLEQHTQIRCAGLASQSPPCLLCPPPTPCTLSSFQLNSLSAGGSFCRTAAPAGLAFEPLVPHMCAISPLAVGCPSCSPICLARARSLCGSCVGRSTLRG